MEDANHVSLQHLLRSARPLTATASLPSPSAHPPPPPQPQPSSYRRFLTALICPTVLLGTLTLPTHTSSPPCSCFRFSDASATLCCDLLHFRPAAIGKEIRVTAWNFIPFKCHGRDVAHGFLEIIDWCFSNPNEGLNPVDSVPLVPNGSGNCGGVDGSRSIHGVVESVGPVSVVPCTMEVNSSDFNSGSKVNLPGFLVQLMCCVCRLCGSKDMLINRLNENRNEHSFTKFEIVYFCGNATSWHPAMTKLIGNRVVLSALKKKMVYVRREESRVMYVTVDNKSVLHTGSCWEKCVPLCLKQQIKGKGECGAYTGVVKGVYMQGMALELDHDVWLLLTDQLHTLIHGLRVGSIISVRNVHFVNPKFSWTKVIVLGACVKTSIIVQSFSPLETVCNVVLQSTGMLGRFIQSLPFSARLWALLLVSSFRKKFTGILSDKEILGSKHKEGLAQMYASSVLPSSVLQTQHGAFTGLCMHNLNGCGREMHCGFLKLVIPMSIFISHCIYTLLRMLKSENHCKSVPVGNQFSIISREARYNGRSVRRIVRSEDVGIVLLGYLKIDPLTRRLQLVDATGGIDVLIPDLPLTWNPDKIYELTDYDVVVDGTGELVDQLELLGSESLSCRTIFNCTLSERQLSTSIFIYCLWKNAKCRKFPLYSCINCKSETETPEPGSYYLFRVSHKFPLQEKYSSKMGSNKSSTFVEAVLLPHILLLAGRSRITHPYSASRDKTEELSKYCISGNNEDKVSIKRRKIVKESIGSLKDELHTSIYELSACSNSFRKSEENKKYDLSASHDISCLVTFRSLQKEIGVCPAVLHSTSPLKDMTFNSKPSSRKILLEFPSDEFLKYQLLQIGAYYILDHKEKDCFSSAKDTGLGNSGSAKFLVDSGKRIWSFSFIYDESLSGYRSGSTSAQDSLSPTTNEVFPKDQIEQLLRRFNDEHSDVCLYLPVNLADVVEDNIMDTEDSQNQLFAISEDSANISLSTQTKMARPNFCFGSQRSNCLFPEGNLISLEGNVVDIHDIDSSFCNSCSCGANLDVLQVKGLTVIRSSFCIHLLVHHHIVNIFGSTSKHAFPTGFGPGVTATFHRILNARAQNKFMLLPVSFIVVKSVEVCVKQHNDRSSYLQPTKDAYNASQDSFSCLISQLPQSLSNKQIVLRCRVAAVFVLVIERKNTNFIAETKFNTTRTLLDIPVACFLLEDGSSSCCCWANAERASTLLRLREELSTSHHLGRILKNHKRITVKNLGLCIDSPYQDLIVSATSGHALCNSDENLLKFLIFNACVGRIWNVVASVMDAEEISQLKKEYLAEMVNVQTMQNICAKEVSYPRTLAEARNVIQELLKS
ncbi:hypothetical protein RJT34_01757 [Clitoria ternatea]|uniref:CST complex subunit CTC1 n=1 Tax=Clitoria ternatea TaxID=43366 RepID=A0AAN9KJT7_CLITE